MIFSLRRWMKTALPTDEKVTYAVHRLGPDEAERQAVTRMEAREAWVAQQDDQFRATFDRHGLAKAILVHPREIPV